MTQIYSFSILPNGGYDIHYKYRLLVHQEFSPNFSTESNPVPLSVQTSEQLAKFIILKLNNFLLPFVTPTQETELSSGVVSMERMMEMICEG